MPLVKCKQNECTNMVAGDATTCPSCGTPNPAVSHEEERLIREIEQKSLQIFKSRFN